MIIENDNLRKLLQQVQGQLLKATNEAKVLAESPDPIEELAKVHAELKDVIANESDDKHKAKRASQLQSKKDQLIRQIRGWNPQANWDRFHMQEQMLREFVQKIGPMIAPQKTVQVPQDVIRVPVNNPESESIEDAK